MARITRPATGLGPGPSRRTSVGCVMEERPNLFNGVRGQRRTWIAAHQTAEVHRRLQSGDAETRRDSARERVQALLNVERFRVPSLVDGRSQPKAESRPN